MVEGEGAFFRNFPKSHDLYLLQSIEPLLGKTVLALLIESRAPWYPPSNTPKGAKIVSVSKNPLREHMVLQAMRAEDYLEGSVAATLRALSEALQAIGLDTDTIANRRMKWRQQHNVWCAGAAKQEKQAEVAESITPPLVMKLLREVVGADCCVLDETIVHQTGIRGHLSWDDPLTFFRAPSGLGQGLGYALGAKLALPQRPVTVTIGNESLMYNPVVPTPALIDEHALPQLILVFNNSQYAVMKNFHKRFYTDGVAVADDVYHRVKICGPRYEESATMIGGIGQRVKIPESCEMRSQQPTQASGPARPRS